MAVESDSVVTNLDKFPPNSRKRRSEPSTQHNSPHKRARSSQMQRSARDVGSSNEKALSEPAASKPEDEEPMMVTRRSKRQTTRSSMSPPQSEQVVSSKSVKTTPQGEPIVQAQGSSVVTNRNTAPAMSPKPKSTGTSKKATVTDEDMEATTSVATGTTSTAKSDPRRSSSIPGKKVQLQKDDNPNVNGPNKNGKRAASPLRNYWSDDENEIRVDYFARVQLRRKVVEIPLMTKNLNKEAKVIEDYADFVEAHDAADSISFGLYKGLVEDHGKKGRGKGKKK